MNEKKSITADAYSTFRIKKNTENKWLDMACEIKESGLYMIDFKWVDSKMLATVFSESILPLFSKGMLDVEIVKEVHIDALAGSSIKRNDGKWLCKPFLEYAWIRNKNLAVKFRREQTVSFSGADLPVDSTFSIEFI